MFRDIPSKFNVLFESIHKAMTARMPRHGFRIDVWLVDGGSFGPATWRVTLSLYEAPYSSSPFSVDVDEDAVDEDVAHAARTLLDTVAADRFLREAAGAAPLDY